MARFAFADKLVNLVAGLGTVRDKASSSTYSFTPLTDTELSTAYRTSWLARKIVDVPALDSCRKWRAWQADSVEITDIEAEENRLGLKEKMLALHIGARLFGGAAIYIGTGDGTISANPLSPDSIGLGGVKGLTVIPKTQLTDGDIQKDIEADDYGKPIFYRMNSGCGEVTIHASRLVILTGAELPGDDFSGQQSWGDSVLQSVFDAMQRSDSTMANVASLVFESKVDVFGVPDLMANVDDPAWRGNLLERFRLAAIGKGINGAIVKDVLETYEQKSITFAGLPDIIDRMWQDVSGAADIPLTRLFGQSPGGLQSTGESDLRNYYDSIQSMQEMKLTPAMYLLDECLIRSALGDRPADVFYNWHSLWQTTAKERADIGKVTAETIKALNETGLWPADPLSLAATNMLTELGVMPGLESAMADYTAANPDGEGDDGDTATLPDPIVPEPKE